MPNISKIKVGNITYDLPCGKVITITNTIDPLAQEVYDAIISSPFNKIKYQNKIYILQREDEYNYYYTNNHLTNCSRIQLNKTSRKFSESSMITIASPFVMHNYIGAKDASSNAITTNGNTYLKLYENKVKRSQFNIKGTNGIEVSSDKDGNVTIDANSNVIAQVSYVDNKVNEIVTTLNALLENY